MYWIREATHLRLLQAQRDVSAADLRAELSARRSQEVLLSARIKTLDSQLRTETSWKNEAQIRLKIMTDLVVSQQATIRQAMQELVIIRGGARIKPPGPEPVELPPDVQITDNNSEKDLDLRKEALREAEEAYHQAIEGLDVGKVLPEVLQAAIPKSVEDWRDEHVAPTEEIDSLIAPGV